MLSLCHYFSHSLPCGVSFPSLLPLLSSHLPSLCSVPIREWSHNSQFLVLNLFTASSAKDSTVKFTAVTGKFIPVASRVQSRQRDPAPAIKGPAAPLCSFFVLRLYQAAKSLTGDSDKFRVEVHTKYSSGRARKDWHRR